MQLAADADARSDRGQDALYEEIFNLRSQVRDRERQIDDGQDPARDERIYHEVTERLEARERSVYKNVGRVYDMSPGRVRNIVGKRRAELGLQRPRKTGK